jgi:hypothetical protein
MEAQELGTLHILQHTETRETEDRTFDAQQASVRDDGAPEAAAREVGAAEAAPEAETEEAELPAAEPAEADALCREAEARAEDAHGFAERAGETRVEEEDTQLGAIRALMMHALGRGVWLTLGEIAEVTEFGEASISAQLRHLRKTHHGGHRVEKRRRRVTRAAAAMRKICDGRRGPVVWEYRVLPPA